MTGSLAPTNVLTSAVSAEEMVPLAKKCLDRWNVLGKLAICSKDFPNSSEVSKEGTFLDSTLY